MAAFRSRIELWAQVAGLLATAWLVWAITLAPYRGAHGYLMSRVGSALWIAFCALTWSALVGLTLWLVKRHLNGEAAPPTPMRTFTAAVWWFAPATILLLQFSPTGLATGLALVVSAARLLCAPSRTADSEAFEPVPWGLSRHWFPALMASAGFQVAAISLLMGHPVPAAALLAMSAALLTSVAIGIGAWVEERPPNLPRSVLGLGLTFLLALMIGVGDGGAGWGLGLGFATGAGEIAGQGDRPEKRTVPETNLPGNYSGVIIWPEIKPVTVLVDPISVGRGGFGRQSRPLTIPFGGEYWMFRWPFRRPPPNSYFRRGTPSALSFSTPDHFPMQMEARRRLEQAISLRCCSRLQIAILNADPSPQTISLELILIDRNLPNTVQQSLGKAALTSVPQRREAVPETLDFQFPASPHLDQFDEIKVIFNRASGRMDRSARISIERFVLIPLG
jgi:hypothetical protein